MIIPMISQARRVAAIALSLLLAGGLGYAQKATLTPDPYFTVLNNAGQFVNGACIWTYVAGTTTAATTWSDVNQLNPNPNPVIADPFGRATIYLAPNNTYKYVIEQACTPPAHGAVIRTQDNITAVPPSTPTVNLVAVAGETLTAGQCAYLSNGSGGKTAGLWYRCDAGNAYSSHDAEIGMVSANIATGATGTVISDGQATGLSSLTIGTTYYVGLLGALSATAGTSVRVVGVADTTSSLVLAANPGFTTARLGSGTPTTTTFLRGDATWSPLGGGTGTTSTFLRGDGNWANLTTQVTTNATGTQNNFNPGIAGNTLILVSGVGPLTITGFPAGYGGQLIRVVNETGGSVSFTYSDPGSSAGNRLLLQTQSTVTLTAPSAFNGVADFVYDSSGARWVMTALYQGDLGTWTPNLLFGGANTGLTTSTNVGSYTIANRMCLFSLRITLTAQGTSTGNVTIGGLPFIAGGNGNVLGHANVLYATGMASLNGPPTGYVQGSGSVITLYGWGAAGVTALSNTNFSNTSDIIISGTYPIF